MLIDVEAFLFGSGRETEVDEARCDDMKSWIVLAPFDKLRKDLNDFDEATRPSMGKEQRNGILDGAPLVNEVYVVCIEIVDRDFGDELGKLVQI